MTTLKKIIGPPLLMAELNGGLTKALIEHF